MLKCFDFSYLSERFVVILLRLLLAVKLLESRVLDGLVFGDVAVPLVLVEFVPIQSLFAFRITLVHRELMTIESLLLSIFLKLILKLFPPHLFAFDINNITTLSLAEYFDRSVFLLLFLDERLVPGMLDLVFEHSDCRV